MASTLTQPDPITIPFAASGNKRDIPTPSQVGVVDGAASYTTGFPALTMTPLASGGIPPSGLDMNGILYDITEYLRFVGAGGRPKFSATLAAAIGGYPVGVELQDDNGKNVYLNVVNGNTTNFNTNPASIGASWKLVSGLDNTITIPTATTSVSGISRLATTSEAVAGTSNTISVTPAGLAAGLAEVSVPAASTTVPGKVELATTAETVAGTDTQRAVTPAGLAGFSKNLSSNGYAKLPGGLILQWGSFNNNSYTAGNQTLPITFPTAFLGVLASNNTKQGGGVDNAFAYPVSLSQFYLATKTSTGDALSTYGVTWFAIGY